MCMQKGRSLKDWVFLYKSPVHNEMSEEVFDDCWGGVWWLLSICYKWCLLPLSCTLWKNPSLPWVLIYSLFCHLSEQCFLLGRTLQRWGKQSDFSKVMERLFEPQFQLHALTILPDAPIIPLCVRGKGEIGGDKVLEQHGNSASILPLCIWSWVVYQSREIVLERKNHLACSLYLLCAMWFLGVLPELQMAACDASLLWKREKVHTDLLSFWRIPAFTCYDKFTKKRKGQEENLVHVRMFKSSQNKVCNI